MKSRHGATTGGRPAEKAAGRVATRASRRALRAERPDATTAGRRAVKAEGRDVTTVGCRAVRATGLEGTRESGGERVSHFDEDGGQFYDSFIGRKSSSRSKTVDAWGLESIGPPSKHALTAAAC